MWKVRGGGNKALRILRRGGMRLRLRGRVGRGGDG